MMKKNSFNVIVLLIILLYSTACSSQENKLHLTSSIEVHNQMCKNIKLVDIQTNRLADGVLVSGNIKYSSRKTRNMRPHGILEIRLTGADGAVITKQNVALNHRGRMPTFSAFRVVLNGTAPKGSHIYLDYREN